MWVTGVTRPLMPERRWMPTHLLLYHDATTTRVHTERDIWLAPLGFRDKVSMTGIDPDSLRWKGFFRIIPSVVILLLLQHSMISTTVFRPYQSPSLVIFPYIYKYIIAIIYSNYYWLETRVSVNHVYYCDLRMTRIPNPIFLPLVWTLYVHLYIWMDNLDDSFFAVLDVRFLEIACYLNEFVSYRKSARSN